MLNSLGPWHRDQLVCTNCRAVPRERAVALTIARRFDDWSSLRIHEASPAPRGLSLEIGKARNYVGSGFFPNTEPPAGLVNVDLEDQVFEADSFDLVVALDVLEHVMDPERAVSEITRTVKPNGLAILTFPIYPRNPKIIEQRARIDEGKISHLQEPSYHGSPFGSEGSLVTHDHGYGIHQLISAWGSCYVEVTTFSDLTHGIVGEFSEVIVCSPLGKGSDSFLMWRNDD